MLGWGLRVIAPLQEVVKPREENFILFQLRTIVLFCAKLMHRNLAYLWFMKSL